MKQTTINYLAEIVAVQGNKVFPTLPMEKNSSALKKVLANGPVEALYKELGGKGNCWNINFFLPEGIETEEVRLSLSSSLEFNRYRAITFQSPLYEEYRPSWLDTFRRNCRTLERECLKDGSRQGIWSYGEAEKHFGPPQENGDFYGNGAPGWKLNAFRNFLSDMFLLQAPQQHKRISEYERLMVQGKLIPLQQLLISRSESNQQYLVKYLSRQLGIPAPQAKGL